ncbi:WG repeat-containing protein [Nostoc sp. UHCC 0702]|nr:WG repeat-containing protein [Nostoc sp. UHCC 0702]
MQNKPQTNNFWNNFPNILQGCAAIIKAIKSNGNIVSISIVITGAVAIPSTVLVKEILLTPPSTPPKIDYAIDPKFDIAGHFSEGLARVKINGNTGYINPTGDMAIPANFDGAQDFSEGLALAWIYNKNRGYIDKNGNFSIQPQYARNQANQFSEGLARVCVVGTCGYINKTGEFAIKRQFTGAGNFSENLAPIKTNDKWGYINTNGTVVITPKFDEAHQFSQKLALIKTNGKWGYIDTKGTVVIEPKFDNASHFSEGLAPIKINGKWGYIDTKGTVVIEAKFNDAKVDPYAQFRCDIAEPAKNLSSANPGGIICHNLENRYSFSEGLASVMIKDKWGYIDKEGKSVIPPQFTRVSKFSEGLAAVCNNEKCGYIRNPLKQ